MPAELVAVLGANGVYARHLIPRLATEGHRVRALVRRPDAAGVARACGAEVRVADIFDEESLVSALGGCDVAVNLATSLPGPSGRGDFEANDRLRRDGTSIWARACRRASVPRVVQQSIAMVNAAGDEWADEEAPASGVSDQAAARAIEAALSMEQTIRDAGVEFLILRGGLFYGPGTGLDDDWLSRARAGTLRLPGDGSAFVSLVHIADMADATATAIARWPAHATLAVGDDRPARWIEIFSYVAPGLASAAAPAPGGRLGFPSFRVRNTRAREVLDWKPRYPDFRAASPAEPAAGRALPMRPELAPRARLREDVMVVSRGGSSALWGELSEAEREVVTLALGGASNREIAARRRRSERTIANQLAATYSRLGVSGRSELAALLGPPPIDQGAIRF